MLAVVLALTAAVTYGVSDFLGGTAAARLRVMPATILSYVAATVALVVLALVTGGMWSSTAVTWGALAGVAAVVGFVAFYAAMAIGPMSLVSPFIAVLSSAVPVVAAILLGERLSVWGWVGIAVAIVAALLLSLQPRAGARRLSLRAAVLSIVAGVGLGSSVIALDFTPLESGTLPALVEIVVGLVLLVVVFGSGRLFAPLGEALRTLGGEEVQPGRRGRTLAAALGSGVLLAVANAAIVAGLQSGSLAVVSVLVGLYPLGTILLARLVAGERMTALQLVGAALAVAAGIVLGLGLGR